MLVNILGPLDVSIDGVAVTPSAPKLRQVVAILAVYANEIVRNEQLIEELWEDKPPSSVTTTLQTYVYQIRKLLNLDKSSTSRVVDRAMPPALHTSIGGYMLSLPPDAVDAGTFEKLATRGLNELKAGRVQDAARTLSQAIQLWRGPALIDVGVGPILRAEAIRLEELRKTALEQRIEADLRLGRHHEVLGELTALTSQHPTHEGFQIKLMLALHRSGRRSESLRAYHRARTALADELGIEPSNELRRIHQAVLTSDERLDLPTQPTVTTTTQHRAPCHLPPNRAELIGRERDLSDVQRVLAQSGGRSPVVVVTGPPGAGKTAACVHAAYRLRERYPDGQLFCRLVDRRGRPADTGDLLAALLRGLGVSESRLPATLSDRALMFRTWTADRRLLVVLDDALDTAQIPTLLPSGAGSGVLIASRRRLALPMVTAAVDLTPLDADCSLHLLTTAIGPSRIHPDPDAARKLIRLCDGLPAALQAVVAKLRSRPHWSARHAVRWITSDLAGDDGQGDPLNLLDSLALTYWNLPEEVRRAFRALCRAGVPHLSPAVAAGILGTGETFAERVLEDLVEAQLVRATVAEPEPGSFRYQILPVFAAVAARLTADHEVPEQDHATTEAAGWGIAR
ncbi:MULTISPECIES: AfsR/SARP family transcriptional regulator [Amycolatopsis]|uniref:AfsR/SARP family transcriptional regulator n=1 Tax=Amycolatopsis TaxID=1813 RepID=UPI000B8A8212|nr:MULTISPECIES: BTAD domain-containing putative transcriptional regulator [Amycolatopsis]OXM62275.1 hypothetical protein CF166_33065 [Amycolatopsis sp. KNN50.9b]